MSMKQGGTKNMLQTNRTCRAMLGVSLLLAAVVVAQPQVSIVEAQGPDVTTAVIATRKVILDDADGT